MTLFTLETEVYDMEFHGCREFEVSKDKTSIQFTVSPEYLRWKNLDMFQIERLERKHCPTGKVTIHTDAHETQQALNYAKDLLFGIEHLLTLAHQHHIFTGKISCYDTSHKLLATERFTGWAGRIGEPLVGSLLWGDRLKQFLDTALPRLDIIPAFRWGLYLFNEVTAVAPPVPQLEIPSLWTVTEFSANALAESNLRAELLADSQIDALQTVVKQELVNLGILQDKRSETYTQLRSLERRPVLKLVDELLAAYSLGEYVKEAEEFYRLRNDVVHGRNIQLTGIDFVNRISRFTRLLQKLLFSMAGVYHMEELFFGPITDKDLSAN